MSVSTEPTVLSKQDIKALRQADEIHCRSSRGEAVIVCVKQVRNSGPFDDRERRYEIAVDSYVQAYDPFSKQGDWGQSVTDSSVCFSCGQSNQPEYSPWPAIAALVREGDELRLEWTADGSNMYWRQASIKADSYVHFDEMSVIIRRNNQTKYVIPVNHSHCEDNTARMIREYALTPHE